MPSTSTFRYVTVPMQLPSLYVNGSLIRAVLYGRVTSQWRLTTDAREDVSTKGPCATVFESTNDMAPQHQTGSVERILGRSIRCQAMNPSKSGGNRVSVRTSKRKNSV